MSLLAYYFLGRGSMTFSQQTRMARDVVDGEFQQTLRKQIMRTPEIVERLEAERLGDVNVKLMSLISNNVGMVLTGRNQVKILQDADNSYPELLAVTEAAYAAALAWLEVGTGQRGADEPVPVGNEVS